MEKLDKNRFEKKSIIDQVSIVLQDGDAILDRIYMYYHIKLFVVNDFFVELWYHQAQNTIGKVKLIEEEEIILFYGNKIDISDGFKNVK